MKKFLNKINKKFLLIFLVFILLECLFIFPQIFGWITFSVSIPDNPLTWTWFLPGIFWFLPFLDGSIGGELWFMLLFFIGAMIIPAGFWTTVIYLVTRLIKTIKKKIKKSS